MKIMITTILSLLFTPVILLPYILFSHLSEEFVPARFPDHLLGVKHCALDQVKASTCLW